MKDLILTLTGPDQTGIVAQLGAIAEKHGGNRLHSRMMRMGGHFSGILSLALPEENQEAFEGDLEAFMKQLGYQYSLQPEQQATRAPGGRMASLDISGQDHPGIIHAIFEVFRKREVNVEELNTGLSIAPWSGTPIFEAKAKLWLPRGLKLHALHKDLEDLSSDLLVELAVREEWSRK